MPSGAYYLCCAPFAFPFLLPWLALAAGGAGDGTDLCQDGACHPGEEQALLQSRSLLQSRAARVRIEVQPRTCAPGEDVPCPVSGDKCAGDQCCSATPGSGGTFPCPSASAGFSGCANNTKIVDCLAASLAQGEAEEEEGERLYYHRDDCAGVPPQSDKGSDYPFGTGSIFALKGVVEPSDPTTYQSDLVDAGQGTPNMYDRKDNKFADRKAFLFTCTFRHGSTDYPITVRASAEDFADHDEARSRVEPFLKSVGRAPEVLMQNLRYIHVYKGKQPWGGNQYTQSLMMYVDMYKPNQVGEVIVHELSHASLDNHLSPDLFAEAVEADCNQYFSKYSRDEPARESFAEGFLVYLAYEFRRDRMTAAQAQDVMRMGRNQIAFFEKYTPRELSHPPA